MPKYKYNEDNLLQELKTYIDKTYNEHYVGDDEIQSIDSIMAAGHGQGFFVGNVQKYAARYGKKAGMARKDLLKILHYALLQLNLHDKEEAKKDKLNKDKLNKDKLNKDKLNKDKLNKDKLPDYYSVAAQQYQVNPIEKALK